MEKSETASRGGRIISNKIKLENLMRIVRLVAAIFQIAIIVIAFMSKQVIVLNITDLKGYRAYPPAASGYKSGERRQSRRRIFPA